MESANQELSRTLSDLRQAEAEREGLIGELRERNAEMERFTYAASHDLKSPLVTIRGFLDYLVEDARTGDQERLDHDVERIRTAADRMGHLLDDVLELSRTEFDLLELLVRNSGVVLSRDVIYERVWAGELEADSKTLDVYIGYLRRKLEARGGSRLVQTVRGVGYVAREDEA